MRQAALFCIFAFAVFASPLFAAEIAPDRSYLLDRELLEEIQRSAFRYMWKDGCPVSGMAYEANFDWDEEPVAVGGTGFGAAAIVTAADRGWITRNEAVARLNVITRFLLDKTDREKYHGAFPHWLNGETGATIAFGNDDAGADLVETSLLLQGLLIARAYFDGPGNEAELRKNITEIWEGVDWDWFTNGEENGLYWHWDPKRKFSGLKILGYNECLITYLLAIASPTHPISRRSYDYWTSGDKYRPGEVFGYDLEAAVPGGGPLFLAHYSFIGLDPRRVSDAFVKRGYFVRGVKQTLSNRGYCLQEAAADNQYGESFWGLTASQVPDGYAANEPYRDSGTVAPTAALSSMPYTPVYSMQVLRRLSGDLRKKVWGENGPYDAINLREDWVSDRYLSIDQLPIVCMIENYRSGLLWKLFMSDLDVRVGLERAGLVEPDLEEGFPEAVVTMKREQARYVEDAHETIRHPETGKYVIPYRCEEAGEAHFLLVDEEQQELFTVMTGAKAGGNLLLLDSIAGIVGKRLFLIMQKGGREYRLPIRFH